eukprot:1143426-Pelagomonas_calceolata.AAC.1
MDGARCGAEASGGPHKPHELLAKLKKGNHPWDGKLYPPNSANTPSKCKPEDLAKAAAMRISTPVSPTTRGAVRRM